MRPASVLPQARLRRQSVFGMKIQVKKLNALKKYVGNFEFVYEPPSNLCLIPLCEIVGSVQVSGNYEIYDDDSVGVEYSVKHLVKGKCSYCLNDAEKQIEKTFEVLFVPEEDGDNYSYDGITIDLTTAVNDAILFSQPNLLLCREDCAGIEVNKKREE